MKSFYMFAAVANGALTLVCAYGALRMPWSPKVDFDVVGFLWVLENLPRVPVIVMAFVFATMTVYCGTRPLLARGLSDGTRM